MSELARNVKKYRRSTGLSQEDLAEAADLSVSTVQKIEQGGTARTETLRAIARGLGVPTSQLFVAGSPAPVIGDEETRRNLVPIRMALMPPVGLDGMFTDGTVAAAEHGRAPDLRRKVLDTHTLYRADQFDSVAKELPELLHETEAARLAAEGGEQRAATITRSLALLVAGKYLTQVRQYDMAYHSLSEGIRLARDVEAKRVAVTGIVGLGWLLLRQGRFGECYRLAVTTAERMEPRMSDTDSARFGLWGELWMRAAASAIRDNRSDDAQHARKMVGRAVGGMEREDRAFPATWGGFGPVKVAIKSIEDCLVAGSSPSDAREVLRRSRQGVLEPKALARTGHPAEGADWSRHRLDLARAHTLLGSHQDAMDELTGIRVSSAEWIKHQPAARRVMQDILHSRKRVLTEEMRDMASYLKVVE
ncbi:helix-turn-helix domain-containing protein [Streptomyces sp. NPDC059578]|uniref:helix-turn-helix domain-containing protein n=1 Tax=Streptomyces sp. NPDC059578 TaxID=3346874 RepID=UPI0036CB4483